MSVEEELKELMIKRFKSVRHFAAVAGIPYGTIVSILSRGVLNSNLQNVITICDILGISVDALAENKIIPVIKTVQNDFDNIGDKVKAELQGLAKEYKYLTQDDINFFNDSMQIVIEQLRRRKKERANK